MIDKETYEKGVWFSFTITALVVFVGSWIYCIANYGFLLGVGLGCPQPLLRSLLVSSSDMAGHLH